MLIALKSDHPKAADKDLRHDDSFSHIENLLFMTRPFSVGTENLKKKKIQASFKMNKRPRQCVCKTANKGFCPHNERPLSTVTEAESHRCSLSRKSQAENKEEVRK